MNKGKHIVLAVCGGIAAYKAAELASRLVHEGADVHAVMTKNACFFVSPLTFETLTHNRVVTDTFSRETPYEVSHVAINKLADAIVVAPATANIMAKAACGIGDDYVSTCLLAAMCPVIYAPAMNTAMYENPATQENMRRLADRGALFVEPGSGLLACGDVGKGRMSEPEEIVDFLRGALQRRMDWAGRRILVTAGPTIERIDSVRYLTNRSTGKMGYAIAEAARDRGAQVTLVTGKTALPAPAGMDVVQVESAADMYAAVMQAAGNMDVIVKAAAVADYTPAQPFEGKLKKSGEDLELRLVRTQDILLELGQRKKHGQVLVGFAAEAGALETAAQNKLERKNLDFIAANDIRRADIGFGADENAVTLYFRDGRREALPKASKRTVAELLLDRAGELLAAKKRL